MGELEILSASADLPEVDDTLRMMRRHGEKSEFRMQN
jgi:hypothetical protein